MRLYSTFLYLCRVPKALYHAFHSRAFHSIHTERGTALHLPLTAVALEASMNREEWDSNHQPSAYRTTALPSVLMAVCVSYIKIVLGLLLHHQRLSNHYKAYTDVKCIVIALYSVVCVLNLFSSSEIPQRSLLSLYLCIVYNIAHCTLKTSSSLT